ncbi:circularly permuted type 2 ATP-grasp protein [Halomonas sp. HP20-15]|uniref:circularly permuted type 2 ATP-grasp protein n=1 Tax=Halomonas sp. HP20-15 TaxID=3085901 RepID=UPI002981A082|nr:circularly permuted type 2 ATP-grasp protein [Halomonas sp. HP20-15]MDW5375320.1 circularly permuted type 2 ATP-grasp protein [Halomonas sp. HP20-15]
MHAVTPSLTGMPTMLVPDLPESLLDTPPSAAAEGTRSLEALLAGYAVGDSTRHDMLFDATGELRPHWRELLEEFAALGEQGLAERADEVQRLLYENGVTFNVHDDLRGRLRTWRVDPLPLVIPAAQWRELEAGLVQRSRLLDALLADIYGPRRLIEEGYLPPELIYEHPGFLFACDHSHDDAPRAGLVFHGVDLILDDQGQWRVVADRLQAPSGAGYALENRIILARAMPTLYREAPLRRLSSFLEAEHRTLAALSTLHREQPNVVLLTPGPDSDGYFEHAYLANYMNLSLVESLDLVVRDSRVWMRTLGGLKPVDVILRRLEDAWCDPLELRADSLIGVPGLVQAARSGGVALANPLGVSVLEHPGLAPYLATLCERLLGEPLKLAPPQSWWCGDPQALATVLDDFEHLTLRDIEPGSSWIRTTELSEAELAVLRQRVEERPSRYVAQRPLRSATAPVYDDASGRFVPRPLNLRAFVTADSDETTPGPALGETESDGRRYRAMPGGLAWAGVPGTPSLDSDVVKDVWVLADEPQRHVSLLRQAAGPIVVTRDGNDLPSRVADSLFWLGRYGERLDVRARLLREGLLRLLEQEQAEYADTTMADLFEVLTLAWPDVGSGEHGGEAGARAAGASLGGRFHDLRAALLTLLDDDTRQGLPAYFQQMLRNSRAVRDHLGDDAWRVLNQLRRQINAMPRVPSASAGRRACEEVVNQLAAFFGLCNETMPHHYGWRFMDIGRFIERVLRTLELLRLALLDAREPGVALWEVVLATTDNVTAYRRRYRSELHPTAILDLLLFDEGNPRSVGYMLKRLGRQIERLPQPDSAPYRSREQRLIVQASSTLQLADIDLLADVHASERAREALASLFDDLLTPLEQLSDAIGHSHFSHAETPKQLIKMQVQP